MSGATRKPPPRGRTRLAPAALVAAVLLLGPAAGGEEAWPGPDAPAPAPAPERSLGVWIGTGVANLAYMPAKIAYAAGGTAVAGLAWVFSGGRSDVASAVAGPSVRGDYFLTPAHLAGERSIVFVGRDPAPAEPAPVARAPEDEWREVGPGEPGLFRSAEPPGAEPLRVESHGAESDRGWEPLPEPPPAPAPAQARDPFWAAPHPEQPAPPRRVAPAPAPLPAPERRAPAWGRREPVAVEELPPVAAPPPVAPHGGAEPGEPREVERPRVWVYDPPPPGRER